MSVSEINYFLENCVLKEIVTFCTIFLDLAGIIVLVTTAVKSFRDWLKKKPDVQLELAQGTLLALTFKMGGEVLRTVVVREWSELGILGAVIILRAALTTMLRWEISSAEKDLKLENSKSTKKKRFLF